MGMWWGKLGVEGFEVPESLGQTTVGFHRGPPAPKSTAWGFPTQIQGFRWFLMWGITDPFEKRMDAPGRTQALQNPVHKLGSHHTQHGPSGPVGSGSLCLKPSLTTAPVLPFALEKETEQKVQNQLGEEKPAVDEIRLTWGCGCFAYSEHP